MYIILLLAFSISNLAILLKQLQSLVRIGCISVVACSVICEQTEFSLSRIRLLRREETATFSLTWTDSYRYR